MHHRGWHRNAAPGHRHERNHERRKRCVHHDQGQVSVLFAVVLVIAIVFVAGMAGAGRVAIERARARTAADAVALAADDPVAQQALVSQWAELGADVEALPDGAHARSGRAQARSWVTTVDAPVARPPAWVAIVARANQILGGEPVVPLRWTATELVMAGDHATRFAVVAPEFGLCSRVHPDAVTIFALC